MIVYNSLELCLLDCCTSLIMPFPDMASLYPSCITTVILRKNEFSQGLSERLVCWWLCLVYGLQIRTAYAVITIWIKIKFHESHMQFNQNVIEMTPYLIINCMACHGIAWHLVAITVPWYSKSKPPPFTHFKPNDFFMFMQYAVTLHSVWKPWHTIFYWS